RVAPAGLDQFFVLRWTWRTKELGGDWAFAGRCFVGGWSFAIGCRLATEAGFARPASAKAEPTEHHQHRHFFLGILWRAHGHCDRDLDRRTERVIDATLELLFDDGLASNRCFPRLDN